MVKNRTRAAKDAKSTAPCKEFPGKLFVHQKAAKDTATSAIIEDGELSFVADMWHKMAEEQKSVIVGMVKGFLSVNLSQKKLPPGWRITRKVQLCNTTRGAL